MKNIAIIISSLKGGGAERVVSNITMHLPEDKYNVYLILFDSSSIEYPYNGELIDINIKPNDNPIIKAINFVRRYFKLKKIKKKYDIDTSISFLGGPNLLNILTQNRDKVIISIRNYISRKSEGFYTYLEKYLIRKTYNKSDIIVSVSNVIKNDLKENYNVIEEKIMTIYNPYDLKVITNLSEGVIEDEYKDIFTGEVVITIGRLNKYKGHWHLIRAFKKINEYNKNVKLVILGEGEMKEYLENLIDCSGLNNNVHLLGFKTNPYKYIKNSSIFVLPSLSEGFPNALVESMVCGVPVISCDCKSGPREILAPNTDIKVQCSEKENAEYGLLVPVFDGIYYNAYDSLTREENIMADSILEMLNNVELYSKYASNSLKRVKDFDINKVIDIWDELI